MTATSTPWTEVDSASNRSNYQESSLVDEGSRCVGLTTLPPSCAICQKSWKPKPLGALRVCLGLYRHSFTLFRVAAQRYVSCTGLDKRNIYSRFV